MPLNTAAQNPGTNLILQGVPGMPSNRGSCSYFERPMSGNSLGDSIRIADMGFIELTWNGSDWVNPIFSSDPALGSIGILKNSSSTLTIGILGDSIVQDAWAAGPIGSVLYAPNSVVGGYGTAGSGYKPGIYAGVPVTGGGGSGATVTVVVGNDGKVSSVSLLNPGTAYNVSPNATTPSVAAASIGGTGSGFTFFIGSLFGTGSQLQTAFVSNAGASANFVNWAAAYSFGRLRYSAVAAQGGWKAQQIIDNMDSMYVPFMPDITVVQIGFNDISGLTSSANTESTGILSAFQSQIIQIIAKVKRLGSLPILCTINPKNTGMAGFTIQQQKWIYAHNAWVRNYCATNAIALFDYANYVVDPADVGGGGCFANLFQTNKQITSIGAIAGGSGYTNNTYYGVALTGGTGTGATANIVVASGVVTSVQIVSSGAGYTAADSLSSTSIGAGTGFTVAVSTVSPAAAGTPHVHGGAEINRALGYELWTNCISKIAPSSLLQNYSSLNAGDSPVITSTGLNLFGNSNMLSTGAASVSASATGMTASGTMPTGWKAFGSATASAVYSMVAHSANPALSTLNTVGLANATPGNFAQCSIDTSIAGNLVNGNIGVGFEYALNWSYGSLVSAPQYYVLRVRVKATALANCAGIFLRMVTGLGGLIYMQPANNGITPYIQDANAVTTPFDVLYQTPPMLWTGGGNSAVLQVLAAIIKTAVGTTTFQISQPEMVFLPIKTS